MKYIEKMQEIRKIEKAVEIIQDHIEKGKGESIIMKGLLEEGERLMEKELKELIKMIKEEL